MRSGKRSVRRAPKADDPLSRQRVAKLSNAILDMPPAWRFVSSRLPSQASVSRLSIVL
jgi:hypothetical protein